MNTRKNMIWLLIMAVCIICLGGCAKKEQEGTPVEISYLNKSETKIVTEQHYLEGTTTKEMIVEVLTLLCSVPENKELKATVLCTWCILRCGAASVQGIPDGAVYADIFKLWKL